MKCPGPGKGCSMDKPTPKPRRNYESGFRAGIAFAIAVQVLTFAAVGAGYVVSLVLS